MGVQREGVKCLVSGSMGEAGEGNSIEFRSRAAESTAGPLSTFQQSGFLARRYAFFSPFSFGLLFARRCSGRLVRRWLEGR